MLVKPMAKKSDPADDENGDKTTTVRVSFEMRALLYDLAKAKKTTIPQLVDDLLGARVREELIGITEQRLKELKSKR